MPSHSYPACTKICFNYVLKFILFTSAHKVKGSDWSIRALSLWWEQPMAKIAAAIWPHVEFRRKIKLPCYKVDQWFSWLLNRSPAPLNKVPCSSRGATLRESSNFVRVAVLPCTDWVKEVKGDRCLSGIANTNYVELLAPCACQNRQSAISRLIPRSRSTWMF